MIFSNLNHEDNNNILQDEIKRCLEYVRNNSLVKYECGKYEIEGNNIFLNIAEYETCEKEARVWEAHRQYIDIHIMLSGTEIIGVDSILNLKQGEYVNEEDFLPIYGASSSQIHLKAGDFLVCYPTDAHKTAIMIDKKEHVKKAIFKIKIT